MHSFYIETHVSVCTHMDWIFYKYTDSPTATLSNTKRLNSPCFSFLFVLQFHLIILCGTLKLFAVLVLIKFVQFLTWHRLWWTNTAMLRLHLFSCFCCGKDQHAVALVQLFILTAELRINSAAVSSFKIQYKVLKVQYDIVHRILLHVFFLRWQLCDKAFCT